MVCAQMSSIDSKTMKFVNVKNSFFKNQCVVTFTAKSTTVIEGFSFLKRLKANSRKLIRI